MSTRRRTRDSSRIVESEDDTTTAPTPRPQARRRTVAASGARNAPSLSRRGRPSPLNSDAGRGGRAADTPRAKSRPQAGGSAKATRRTRASVARELEDEEEGGDFGGERLLRLEDLMMDETSQEESEGEEQEDDRGQSAADVLGGAEDQAMDRATGESEGGDEQQGVSSNVEEDEDEEAEPSHPSSPTLDAAPLLDSAERLLELVRQAMDDGQKVDEGQFRLRWEILKSNKALFLPTNATSLSASLSSSSASYFLLISTLSPSLQAAARTSDLATFLRALVLADPTSTGMFQDSSDVEEDLSEAWRLFLRIFDPKLTGGDGDEDGALRVDNQGILTLLLDFSTQLFIRRVRAGLLRRDRSAVLDELFSRSLIDRRSSSFPSEEGRRMMNDRWIAMRDARVKSLKTLSMSNLYSTYSFTTFLREMVRFGLSRYQTEVLGDEEEAQEEQKEYMVPLNDGPSSRKRGRTDESNPSSSRRRQTISTLNAYNRSASTGPSRSRSRSRSRQLNPTPLSKRNPRRSLPTSSVLAARSGPAVISPLPGSLSAPASKPVRREERERSGTVDKLEDAKSTGARSEAELEEMLAEENLETEDEDEADDEDDEEEVEEEEEGGGEQEEMAEDAEAEEMGLARATELDEEEALASEEESLQLMSDSEEEEENGPELLFGMERAGVAVAQAQSSEVLEVEEDEDGQMDTTIMALERPDDVPPSEVEEEMQISEDDALSEKELAREEEVIVGSGSFATVEILEAVKQSVVVVGASTSIDVDVDEQRRLDILSMSLLDELTEEELLTALEIPVDRTVQESVMDEPVQAPAAEQAREPLFLPESSAPPSPTQSEIAQSRLAKGKGRALPTTTPAYSPPPVSKRPQKPETAPTPLPPRAQQADKKLPSSQPSRRTVRRALGTDSPDEDSAFATARSAREPSSHAQPRSTIHYPPGYQSPPPIASATPFDDSEDDDSRAASGSRTASPPHRRMSPPIAMTGLRTNPVPEQTTSSFHDNYDSIQYDDYPSTQRSSPSHANLSPRHQHYPISASQAVPAASQPSRSSQHRLPSQSHSQSRSYARSRSRSQSQRTHTHDEFHPSNANDELDSPSLPSASLSTQKKHPRTWGAKEDAFFRIASAEVPLTETQPWSYLMKLYGDKGRVNKKLAGRDNTALRDRMRVILSHYPFPDAVPPGLERYLQHTDSRRAKWVVRLRKKSYREIAEGHVDPRKLGSRNGRRKLKEGLLKEEKALREKRKRLEALEKLLVGEGEDEEEEEEQGMSASGDEESEVEERRRKRSRGKETRGREKSHSQRTGTRSMARRPVVEDEHREKRSRTTTRSSQSQPQPRPQSQSQSQPRSQTSAPSLTRSQASAPSQRRAKSTSTTATASQPPRQASILSNASQHSRTSVSQALSPTPSVSSRPVLTPVPESPQPAMEEEEEGEAEGEAQEEAESESDWEAPTLAEVMSKKTRSAVPA